MKPGRLWNALAAADAGLGLALIDRDLRVVQASGAHLDRFPDLRNRDKHCYQSANEWDEVCPWCPVVEAFRDGRSHVALTASPVGPPRFVEYSYIGAIPVTPRPGEPPSCVVEVVWPVTDTQVQRRELTARRRRMVADFCSELVMRSSASDRPFVVAYGAVSAHALAFDEAEYVDLEAPGAGARVGDRARRVIHLVRNVPIAGLDALAGELQLSGRRSKVIARLRGMCAPATTSFRAAPIPVAQALAHLDAGELAALLDALHMPTNHTMRLSPSRAAVLLTGEQGVTIGVLIVQRRQPVPLLVEDDLDDLDLYGTLTTQAVLLRRSQRELENAIENVNRATGDLTDRASDLVYASRIAVGYGHELIHAVREVLKLYNLVVSLIPSWARRDTANSRVISGFGNAMAFIRTCGEHLESVEDLTKAHPVACHTHQVIAEAIVDRSHRFLVKGVECKTELRASKDKITADPFLLKQALHNLLDNAIYWTASYKGRRPTVTVRTMDEGDSIRVEVSDNGQGVSPGLLDSMWEPFVTGRKSDKGTGMGLFIVRRVVRDLHGGEVGADSELFQGTTLWFTLPRQFKGPK